MTRIISKLAAFSVLLAMSAPATAQNWPTRPITMVVPFAAGSGSDIVGRIVSARLSEVLGQPVVVENVSGAGGMTAAYRVARAAPDGYQLVLGTAGTHSVSQSLHRKPLYDGAADFAPVTLIGDQHIVLLARPDLPANDLPEFTAYAKAHQGQMQFGSPGAGTQPHLACVLINAAAGIEATHIPYRGAVPAMQDLMAGRIDYQCVTLSPALPLIASNKVKAIAIVSHDRSPSLPALATAHEQGLTDFDVSSWYAIFLPKGTPVDIVRKLNDAIAIALDTPAVREKLKQVGIEPVPPQRRSPEYLRAFVASEIAKWAGSIKVAGIALQ